MIERSTQKILKTVLLTIGAAALTLISTSCTGGSHSTARFPANIDHSSFDSLLSKYVDSKGLVDYKTWKKMLRTGKRSIPTSHNLATPHQAPPEGTTSERAQ